MKRNLLAAIAVVALSLSVQAQVKIGNNPGTIDGSSLLEMESTNKGILIPRMTMTQRDAISSSPATGLLIYQTDNTPGFYYYNGTSWGYIGGGNSLYSGDGTTPADVDITVTDNIDFDNGTLFIDGTNNRTGIGTTTPAEKLDVNGNIALSGEVIQESWNTATLKNSWVKYGGTGYEDPSYFKDKQGIVHVRGMVKGGNRGTVCFTLPTGYRPSKKRIVTSVSSGRAVAIIDILANGDVVIDGQIYVTSWTSLEFSFTP